MSKSGERGLRFVVVTTNKGKAKEFEEIFLKYGLRFRLEPLETPEVQSMDLKQVATKSALYAYSVLREPVMVEDAGLFIDALKGFPGPFSSYVFKTIGIQGVLKLMEGVKDRRARFKSVLAFYCPLSDSVYTFTGEVEGWIAEKPRGTRGFGFDPIFVPAEGDGRTFGEMDVKEKNEFSHRARSAEKFAKWFVERYKVIPPPYE